MSSHVKALPRPGIWLKDMLRPQQPSKLRKSRFVQNFLAVGVITLATFSAVNFLADNDLSGVVELSLALAALADIFMLRVTGKVEWAGTGALLIIFTALSYLLLTGGIDNTGIFWFSVFPPLAFFLKQRRGGIIWMTALLAMILLVTGLQAIGLAHTPYPLVVFRQLIATLIVLSFLVYFYENLNELSQRLIRKRSQALAAVNRNLRSEISHRLNTEQRLSRSASAAQRQASQLNQSKSAMLNVLEDLSGEKHKLTKINDKMIEQNVFLDALLERLPVGVVLVDAQTLGTQLMNKTSRKLFSVHRHLDVDQPYYELTKYVKEDGRPYPHSQLPIMLALRRKGPVTKADLNLLQRDGSTRNIRGTAMPIRDRAGKITSIVGVYEDITEQVRLDRTKDEFVSLASHQLRTPASGVKAVLSMLVAGDLGELNPTQRRFAKEAYRTNEREVQLIDDLLNVARLESGRTTLNLKRQNIGVIIKQEIHANAPLIKRYRQIVKFSPPARPVYASVDQEKLHMILDNLISNASKYTPAGGSICIMLTGGQKQFTIAVTDTGIGIAKKDYAKLFKKFSRVDSALTGRRGGTGLGLYLVKQLVAMHHGHVSFESRLGKGTTFKVQLPQRKKKQ